MIPPAQFHQTHCDESGRLAIVIDGIRHRPLSERQFRNRMQAGQRFSIPGDQREFFVTEEQTIDIELK